MTEVQVKRLLQTMADIIGEEKGLKIYVELKKKWKEVITNEKLQSKVWITKISNSSNIII